ncbi:myo-inositol 2-dehydrogenase/D-chiro-inositol 1-dehydrogenase [Prosthecobacter fusiformis]|uniref:Myo-inositol 2-dehydrogenase/D-chiro-inositol 1-dehydrogenase n=1 Tax=Prosthecobacter fusiformis TaxID=48464 RepID=A0A4R7SSJ5_9BACT|nr:Gfo/Idh/MocA family oxidoreductase [Prosthecobacter fusiformis]TDU81456.1 myo-inositol 2-dehydrogenase/D-chiro-inositol 1-dehydrogenase [Prosthecobacter fusiformis]
MSVPVRFALAGFGAWGKLHAQSIAGNVDAHLVAIAAPSDASRAEAEALYPGVQIFADAAEMIAQAEFDILDIVTPSHTHREMAVAAMTRGKHVLLEKPMAITLEDCKAIVAAAKEHGVQLAVGHELRLSSQWGEIKKIIDSGRIGEPQYVLVELLRKPYRLGASGWRYDPHRVGSWVLEEPIHFFDLARWYLEGSGDPVELYAYGNSRDAERPGLFDNFSAMFKYANGSYAVVSQTLAAFEHHQTVKVSGTKGALWAGWSGALDRTLEPSYFLKVFDGENLEEVKLEKHSGEVFELREEIAQCVEMVRTGKPPVASGMDGLWSAGLCLVAEESIRQGKPLPVGEMLKF